MLREDEKKELQNLVIATISRLENFQESTGVGCYNTINKYRDILVKLEGI